MDNFSISEIAEKFSFIRGAGEKDDFRDDTMLSTISSFQPIAVSTGTKSSHFDSSALTTHSNGYRFSFSPLRDRGHKKFEETSSLGILHGSPNLDHEGDNCGSWPWSMEKKEYRDFSAEVFGKGVLDNAEFMKREEVENQAKHPFLQEEIMLNDSKKLDNTSSWSVSRALENEQPLHTSSGSSVSPTFFFLRQSGPLGQLDGSALPSSQRPSFGFKTALRRPIAKNFCSLETLESENAGDRSKCNGSPDLEIEGGGLKVRNHRYDQPEPEEARFATKPPRAPPRSQRSSFDMESRLLDEAANLFPLDGGLLDNNTLTDAVMGAGFEDEGLTPRGKFSNGVLSFQRFSNSDLPDHANVRVPSGASRPREQSSHDLLANENSVIGNNTSCLSPSVMKTLCQNVSISDASILAKDILAIYDREKQKAASRKGKSSGRVAASRVGSDCSTNCIPQGSEDPKKKKAQDGRSSKQLANAKVQERKSSSPDHETASDHNHVASKLIEMRIDGILYKGVLYAQPNL